jgi:hypothetical protein
MGLTQKLGTIPLAIFTDASNNIGIGGSPSGSYKFEVTGTGRFTTSITIDGAGSQIRSGNELRFYRADNGIYTKMFDAGSLAANGFTFDNMNAEGFHFKNAGTTIMRMNSSGNVGIGTSSPSARLTIYGGELKWGFTSDFGALSYTDGKPMLASVGALDFLFYTNGSERMRITSGGNVGIGTSSPTYKLQVSGNTYLFGASSGSGDFALVVQNSSSNNMLLVRNDGAVTIPGSLSKGSGSFRIDHPLESMNKTHQLVHSFVEAPQADLYYRGKLTLVNGKGQANIDEVATMTEGTFEALCREVQCFTTNESGWDLIKGKVIANIIYIESQNQDSTDEISWLVIGERKDKHMMETEWTDDNGKVIVEPLKEITPLENKS